MIGKLIVPWDVNRDLYDPLKAQLAQHGQAVPPEAPPT